MKKNKPGAGRPKVEFTEKEIEQVEKLAAVLSKRQIADFYRVTEKTFGAICERQPEVDEAYRLGKANAIKRVADKLLTIAMKGDLGAIIFYLKTQASWGENYNKDPMEMPRSEAIVFTRANNANTTH